MIFENPKMEHSGGLRSDEAFQEISDVMEISLLDGEPEVSKDILLELTRALKEALSKPEIEYELRKIYSKES